MATKNKKTNTGLIAGICIAIVIVIVIIIAVVINNRGLNDSYFVSDGSKYVLTIVADDVEQDENSPTNPIKIHSVYDYSGDAITGLKTYYQYADAATAKSAYDSIPEEDKTSFKEIYVDGKYIVFVSNEADYKDTTASEVKQNIDFIESLKNANTNNVTNTDTVDSDGNEENTETVETEAEQTEK